MIPGLVKKAVLEGENQDRRKIKKSSGPMPPLLELPDFPEDEEESKFSAFSNIFGFGNK